MAKKFDYFVCFSDITKIACKQAELLKETTDNYSIDNIHENIKVAIMGCAVNGPGEAADADLGVAGGNGEVLLFAKGKPLYKVAPEKVTQALLEEIDKL